MFVPAFPSISRAATTAAHKRSCAGDFLHKKPRPDRGEPAEVSSGPLLSGLPQRPASTVNHLPAEVHWMVAEHFEPNDVEVYTGVLDPSVVPVVERDAAQLSLRIGQATGFEELEACLDQAIVMNRMVRHRPMHYVLNRLQELRPWPAAQGTTDQIARMLEKCLAGACGIPPIRAFRLAKECSYLYIALVASLEGTAPHLSAMVQQLPALLDADRLPAIREALAFVGRQISKGSVGRMRGQPLDAVVNACLAQAQLLTLPQRLDMVRRVTELACAWRRHLQADWARIDQAMMDEIARLPVTSLHAAVASTDDAFIRIVSRLLARLPLGERAAFFDDLLASLPERPAARSDALVNLGALLPMLPGAQSLPRLTKITEGAAELPPGDRDGADVLRPLVSAATFRRLPPGHVGPAIQMLLQAAQQILMAREDLFDYLDDLDALVFLAPWPERAALMQVLDQARTVPTA